MQEFHNKKGEFLKVRLFLLTTLTKMKLFSFLLVVLVLASCSPKLKTNITKSFSPLSENELLVVLDISDDQKIENESIGELKAVDNGLSVHCTYFENVQNLKKMARKVGANLIRITKQKNPDKWSTCHRLWAQAYKVTDPSVYETQIEWAADRKLTWNDFKGEPDLVEFPKALAVTNSGFGYESGINMFKAGKVFVQSVFNTQKSWVLPHGKTDYVLRHEQIHFDITEIYSRKLRKELADAKVTSGNSERAKSIFEKVFNELEQRQERYDSETARGSEKETQEHWEAVVKLELAKYDLFKSNE